MRGALSKKDADARRPFARRCAAARADAPVIYAMSGMMPDMRGAETPHAARKR